MAWVRRHRQALTLSERGIRLRRRRHVLAVVAVAAAGLAVLFRYGPARFGEIARPLHEDFRSRLLEQLVSERQLPRAADEASPREGTIIYVMGGGQESLNFGFKTAGKLYHREVARKILVMSEPGLNEYSPSKGRRLTNGEWACAELAEERVRREDMELVELPKGLFGTLTEARGITGLALERGCRTLVLVSAPHHTRRVYHAFTRCAAERSLDIFVYGSEEKAGVAELLSEYCKLLLYDYILLPASACGARRGDAARDPGKVPQGPVPLLQHADTSGGMGRFAWPDFPTIVGAARVTIAATPQLRTLG